MQVKNKIYFLVKEKFFVDQSLNSLYIGCKPDPKRGEAFLYKTISRQYSYCPTLFLRSLFYFSHTFNLKVPNKQGTRYAPVSLPRLDLWKGNDWTGFGK